MTAATADAARVYGITRPHPNLLKSYVIRAVLTGPGLIVVLPYLYFRYHTMRYRFDDEGVTMQWGIIFRHEVRLNYGRIQDIHLTSGLVQRWLDLADLHIQTAAGSASAEMTIEGLREYGVVRDFLYRQMRGMREMPPAAGAAAGAGDETAVLLRELLAELNAARIALERLAGKKDGAQ